ncbi:hypothetical protein [Microscilla marina]|nr:hypothetical protein [Microscilla marina]
MKAVYDYLFFCCHCMAGKDSMLGEKQEFLASTILSINLVGVTQSLLLMMLMATGLLEPILKLYLFHFIIGLLASAILSGFLHEKYFVKSNRYKKIIEKYHYHTKRKKIFLGVVAFIFTCVDGYAFIYILSEFG